MIDCKPKEFYDEYFSSIDDICLVKPFKEDNGIFIGTIELKHTIYPLQIDVEVPKLFPYKKVVFWTESLYGYPHLIYNSQKRKSWFCLNTPFAETASNQLNIEIERLRGWIARMMNEALPARIEDRRIINSLRFANVYSWEVFSNDEYNSESRLILVGDFASDPNSFAQEGTLHCRKVSLSNTESRFYAFKEEGQGNTEIPYVIVEGECDNLGSWQSVSSSYGFDDEMWNRLLPLMHVEFRCYSDEFRVLPNLKEQLENIDQELKETSMSEEHRFYIEQEIECYKSVTNSSVPIYMHIDSEDDFLEEGECITADVLAEKIKIYNNKEFYFAIGIKIKKSLKWYLFSTSRSKKISKSTCYKIGKLDMHIYDLLDIKLNYYRASSTDYKHYFGRGCINGIFANKQIAIIGVGALGSCLLDSLVRSGARKISIWDGDKVEPGNICRSIYTLDEIGLNKAKAAALRMSKLSPFCEICCHTYDLYGTVNYNSQETWQEELNECDLIFDCTASNELLHFLSYAIPDRTIVSLCITNHAKELLCLSSVDGNVFEQRKIYLSMLEQDTNNFYVEGTGCYSPTFLATISDITCHINLYLSKLDDSIGHNTDIHSAIISSRKGGAFLNVLKTYKLGEYGIELNIFDNTIRDIYNLPDTYDYAIGYLLGGYSEDRTHVYVSHVVCSKYAQEMLSEAFDNSEGLIDYIGEIHYSTRKSNVYKKKLLDDIRYKASDPDINTNNPLVGLRNPDGSVSFFLYINNTLCRFIEEQ